MKDFPAKKLKFERYIDVRYRRQAHEITIPYTRRFIKTFHETHRKMYGYMKPESEIEVVTIRLRAIAKRKKFTIPESDLGRRIKSPYYGTRSYSAARRLK